MKYSFRAKLFETQTLLAEADEPRWSGVLADLLARYDQAPTEVRRTLLSLYARNDSFSDFALETGDAGTAETNRRFDRLRADLHRACVDEENAANGIADDAGVDFRQLAIEFAIVAVPLFLLEIAVITSVGFIAGMSEYIAVALRSLAGAIALCASYRTLRTLLREEQPQGPGQYVTLGLGTMVAYFATYNLLLAIWSHVGLGVPAFQWLDLSVTYAGVALPAAAMLYGARQRTVEPPWRHALLAGSILFGALLLPAGLYAIQWAVVIAVGQVAVVEALAAIGSALSMFVLGLAGLAWLAYILGIYARECSNGERYPWMHYAPLVMWGFSILAIATLAVGLASGF
ncbi:MAG TPA: hypothetical protein VGN57_21495 [Pirellulaceae bacterium]|jgi:hypothetical protein|nr:hypothetical protein [Pirellulaceae bacterium]